MLLRGVWIWRVEGLMTFASSSTATVIELMERSVNSFDPLIVSISSLYGGLLSAGYQVEYAPWAREWVDHICLPHMHIMVQDFKGVRCDSILKFRLQTWRNVYSNDPNLDNDDDEAADAQDGYVRGQVHVTWLLWIVFCHSKGLVNSFVTHLNHSLILRAGTLRRGICSWYDGTE